jgi:hypothetical protein
MLRFDLLAVIPQGLKRQALDALGDSLSDQAKKLAGDELAAKIKNYALTPPSTRPPR